MYTSSIVGLIPELPEDLTVPGGEAAQELHVTLVYMTDDHTSLTPEHRAAIGEVLRRTTAAIEAPITGVRTLGSDDPAATVLLLDSPELQALRPALKQAMIDAGVPVPEDTYPTYIPHITVGYGTPLEDADRLVGQRVTLGTLAAFYGPDRDEHYLGAREDEEEEPMANTWSGVIARLGVPTGDGRIISPAGVSNRALPLPLMWQRLSNDGHMQSVTVGMINEITYDYQAGEVLARGELLDPEKTPEVTEVMQLLEKGVVGPSVDPGAVEYEILDEYSGLAMFTRYEIAGTTLVSVPAFSDVFVRMDMQDGVRADQAPVKHAICYDDDGELIDCPPGVIVPDDSEHDEEYALVAAVRSEGWCDLPVAERDAAWDGGAAAGRLAEWAGLDGDSPDWERYARGFLFRDDDADPETRGAYKMGIADIVGGELTLIPRGVFAAAAVLGGGRGGVDAPEAAQDRMRSVLSGIYACADLGEAPFALVAAGASAHPLAWYGNPGLAEPTPLVVTEDGRVFGHLALWDTCHVGLPGCVTPPRSMTAYAYFTTGSTLTADGETVPVGTLTVGTGHADAKLGYKPAVEHYDHTGTAVAEVSAGEDEFGIWVAGAVLSEATEEQVAALRRSPLSGDWRRMGGNLELVAALAVNVPGFPVPRARVYTDGQEQYTLVASARFEHPDERLVMHNAAGEVVIDEPVWDADAARRRALARLALNERA